MRRDIFGVALPPIVIPAVKPLMRCAIMFASIAPGAGETDVSSLMPAILSDRDDVIDLPPRGHIKLNGTIPDSVAGLLDLGF